MLRSMALSVGVGFLCRVNKYATIPNGLFFSVPSNGDLYCVVCLFGRCLAIPQQNARKTQ